ncbi:hypothetical protein [Metabacillus arenae]|uniref:Uncharacterized protein n=1 Tax=Metabacillus arenae TaxID=2771434 RepID=A0A926NNF2_9BACI|nr:hypothetical protein [Metabacillus arenae]MBD1381021.1 hypothetical protein [Metabacillus arenae]
MFKQKTEVIPFREFMRRQAIPLKEQPYTPILYSLLPGMSIESFFNMSPQMTGLYALVLGAGALGILSHLIEVNAAKSGFENVDNPCYFSCWYIQLHNLGPI